MFISYFKRFLKIFAKGEEIKFIFLLLMSVIAGFLEFVGISLIFPLIVLMLNPEKLTEFKVLNQLAKFGSYENVICLITVFVIGALVLKSIFIIVNTYYQIHILKKGTAKLNLLIFKKYLFSTYESKLNLPSKYSLFKMWQLCNLVFDAFVSKTLYLISNAVILSVILLFLLIKFKLWAVLTCVFFLVSGLLQHLFFSKKGRKLVAEQIKIMDIGNQNILSAISNFKDMKIFGKENYFFEQYEKYLLSLRKVEILKEFYITIPQNIVELCIIGAIIIMSLGIVTVSKDDASSMVASFGMLAAAMFRMAPLVNKIQINMNHINSHKPAVREFFNAYEYYSNMPQNVELTDEILPLENNIKIEKLGFAYNEKLVLRDLHLNIKKGEFVGVIGPSGVGKTTFIDVLMGLLTTYSGGIFIDDEKLTVNNVQKWINTVGYVPQEITTLPVSIAKNVAFGIPEKEIDYQRVKDALNKAQLGEYLDRLPNGVNEELKSFQNLSQGQKQRIGIARALYKDPQVLFLDEITSALDVETENRITESLNALKGEKTIIAIAHRLSTLKRCDKIFYFKSADCVLCGTFEELSTSDIDFANMLKLASVEIESK